MSLVWREVLSLHSCKCRVWKWNLFEQNLQQIYIAVLLSDINQTEAQRTTYWLHEIYKNILYCDIPITTVHVHHSKQHPVQQGWKNWKCYKPAMNWPYSTCKPSRHPMLLLVVLHLRPFSGWCKAGKGEGEKKKQNGHADWYATEDDGDAWTLCSSLQPPPSCVGNPLRESLWFAGLKAIN